MNYKTYAETKIANPDCEIVTTTILHSEGRNYEFLPVKFLDGNYESQIDNRRPNVMSGYWVVCKPADHCSTLKEFLDAGLELVEGDKYLGTDLGVHINDGCIGFFDIIKFDEKRYILSAAALNGGSKIPDKVEPWTVYNNALPLSDLSDEQAAMLFNAWRAGGEVEFAHTITKDLKSGFTTFKWSIPAILNWGDYQTYRIKQKSDRELFIEAAINHGIKPQKQTPVQIFGELFDSGRFEYKDDTRHFGENI